jgi:uncharacterized protein YyaL (SSP411 family)
MRVAPTTIPAMLCALDFALGPVEQVVVVGTPAERAPFLERLHRQFAPNRVTLAAAPGDPLCARPLFAGRTGPGVRMPAAYLCRDGACAAPVFTPEALDEALRTRP